MELLSMCKFLLGCAMGCGGLKGVGCGSWGLGKSRLVLFMGLIADVIILVGLCSLLFIHYFIIIQIVRMPKSQISYPSMILIFSLLYTSYSYLDISLQVKRTPTYISYLLPMKINNIDYSIATSLEDNQNYIVPISQKVKQLKKNKKHKEQKNKEEGVHGVVLASSLEGYSFQGWKRFFMEAFLYIQSRYYHEVKIDMESLQKKQKQDGQSDQAQLKDGLLSFGPDLQNNKIYQLLKANNEFITKDIVSIYRGINDKNVRMQLGGFEEGFARGHRNGILFYEMDLSSTDGKWWVSVKSMSCMRERNGKDDIFYLANSQLSLAINIQSPLLKLPIQFSSQLERNFQTLHTSCSITKQNRLACINMTSVDLALNFIQLQIDSGAFINISLYDLRESYDEKTNQTLFAIEFVENQKQLQLGEALFKSYYVSIDMADKKMFFSPINRFPSENYGVYVVRFFVGFGIFMIVTAIGAMIWQMCSDPYQKNKLRFGQEGIQLVSYQRPGTMQSEQL